MTTIRLLVFQVAPHKSETKFKTNNKTFTVLCLTTTLRQNKCLRLGRLFFCEKMYFQPVMKVKKRSFPWRRGDKWDTCGIELIAWENSTKVFGSKKHSLCYVVFELFSLKAMKKRLQDKEVNDMQNVNFVTALSRTWLLKINLSRGSEVCNLLAHMFFDFFPACLPLVSKAKWETTQSSKEKKCFRLLFFSINDRFQTTQKDQWLFGFAHRHVRDIWKQSNMFWVFAHVPHDMYVDISMRQVTWHPWIVHCSSSALLRYWWHHYIDIHIEIKYSI